LANVSAESLCQPQKLIHQRNGQTTSELSIGNSRNGGEKKED